MVTITPNQAIAFNIADDNCSCGGAYCQPVQLNDVFELQGRVTVKGSNTLGPFVGADWSLLSAAQYSITGGKLFKALAADTGFVPTANTLGLTVGKMYRIEVKVNVTDPDTTTTDQGYIIFFNGDPLKLPGTTEGSGYNQSLHATWYVKVANIADDSISFRTTNHAIAFNVEYVNLQEVSQVGLAFYDSNGNQDAVSLAPSGLLYESPYKYAAAYTSSIIYPFYNIDSPSLLWYLPILFGGYLGVADCYQLSIFDASLGTDNKTNISACLDVRSSHDCTLLFTATNNDGAFGLQYAIQSGGANQKYTHHLRVKAKRDLTSYPEDAETYLFSDNSEALLFGRTQREHSIFVTDAPVHIHDCLRHLRLHDLFKIDGAEFVKSGAYELNRRKTSSLKQATFTVREAEGIASNYRLT